MVVLLIFVANPVTYKGDSDYIDTEVNNSNISYNSAVVFPENYNICQFNEIVIQDKKSRELIEDGTLYSFVNMTEKVFIQYRCFDSNIIVEKVFFFENIQN